MNDSFILYTSYYAIIEGLTDEQLGQLTRALFLYARDGKTIELDPVVAMAFAFIKDNLDRNAENYQKKCERNRENIRKRWNTKNTKNTNVYDRIQSNTNVYDKKSRIPYDNDNDNEYDNDIPNGIDNINNTCNKLQVSPQTEFCDPEAAPRDEDFEGKGKKEKIDYAAIRDYWNERHDKTSSSMKRLTMMSDRRKTMIRARLRQVKGDTAMLYQAIDTAMASDFMNGNNKRGWTASFDWIFGSENNFAKTLDGYDDAPARRPKQQNGGAPEEPSLGELYRQAQQAEPEADKAAEQRARYLGLIELLEREPKSLCRGALVTAYKAGTLKRLGIDWSP